MNAIQVWDKLIAELDPSLSTAIGTLTAAISMAIVTIVSYYFPKDRSKFDEYEVGTRKKKKRKQKQIVAEENGGSQ